MTVYVNGVISNDLTPEVDWVQVTGTKKETVYGAFTGNVDGAGNTLTPNDAIQGNGKTVLDISISNWGNYLANNLPNVQTLPELQMPGVDVDGVKVLRLKNLEAQANMHGIVLDATNWGGEHGYLERIVTSGSKNMEFQVNNLTAGPKLTVEAKGTDHDIDVIAANFGNGVADIEVINSAGDGTTAKTILNGVDMIARAGKGDTAHLTYTDDQRGTIEGVTIGKMKATSVGDLAGQRRDASIQAVYSATPLAGNAVIGDLTVAKVIVTGGSSEVTIDQTATSAAADAGIGELTVGQAAMTGNDASNLNFAVHRTATSVLGNAVVEKTTIGSVTSTVAAGSSNIDFTVLATSAAGKLAGVGEVKVGNVTATSGTGPISVNVDVGVAGGGGVGGKENVVESVTIGNVSVTTGGGGADVDMAVHAVGGGIAGVTVGNASVSVGASLVQSTTDLELNVTADGVIGNVTVGNLSAMTKVAPLALGTATNLEKFGVFVEGASVGDFKVGQFSLDVAGNVGNNVLPDSQVGLDVHALTGAIGSVTVGDVSIDSNAVFNDDVDLHFQAFKGIGASTIGKIDVTTNSNLTLNAQFGAGSNLGAVTIGEVIIDASAAGRAPIAPLTPTQVDAAVHIDLASSGAAAGLTIGNVTLVSNGTVGVGVTANDVANASLTVDFVGGTKVGDVVIGDLDLSGKNGKVANTELSVDVASNGGNIKIGDINLSSAVSLVLDELTADVHLHSSGAGNIVVGDITVSGGSLGFAVIDSTVVNPLSWLKASTGTLVPLPTDGTVTVGDIDYSAFTGAAEINVSKWSGAELIKGAQGNSLITGNAGQNVIELYSELVPSPLTGSDTVTFAENQTGGTDTALADVIKNFEGGLVGSDQIVIDIEGTAATSTAHDGGVATGSYQDFLAAADLYFQTSTDAVFFQKYGDEYLVAVDYNHNAQTPALGTDYVFIVETVPLSTLVAADITVV